MRAFIGAAAAALILVPTALGDAVYHSDHIALSPLGGASLRSGFVENIHPNGPIVFAHEEYVLNGAAPTTTYSVTLHISDAADTSCSSPLVSLTTATFSTNEAGNGTAEAVFSPGDVDGLHDSTVHGQWMISSGGTVEYVTACVSIQLD
jgi:hypothetical protein